MRVEWTLHAVDTVAAIRNHIAQQSPRYAQRMVERIVSHCRQEISYFWPDGPEYQNMEIREILEGPYRIIYRVHPGRVRILAVVHGARALPENPPE